MKARINIYELKIVIFSLYVALNSVKSVTLTKILKNRFFSIYVISVSFFLFSPIVYNTVMPNISGRSKVQTFD